MHVVESLNLLFIPKVIGIEILKKIKVLQVMYFFYSSTVFPWSWKKQSVVALSLCEARHVVTAFTVCEAIWLKNLFSTLDQPPQDTILISIDNKSLIKLAKNLVQHGRSKHIDTRFHFLRDHVKQKTVKLTNCHTLEQVVDIITKPLSFKSFPVLKGMLGIKEIQRVQTILV